MARFSFYSVFCLLIFLAFGLPLFPAYVSPVCCAGASALKPGNIYLSQAESPAEDNASSDTDLPPGPLAYEKTGSRVTARLYAGFNYRTDALDWNMSSMLIEI